LHKEAILKDDRATEVSTHSFLTEKNSFFAPCGQGNGSRGRET